ncbi:MAG: membrane protein insertion efficiency factor YidD [Clostridia bacterium]|nr:membrane protein insertion efficiency factor YidD [Clostridia bacterium]
MKYLAIGLLKFYKRCISPWKPRSCKYYPSCSVYAMEVYRSFGFIKGSYLTARRLLSCNPWAKGGFDAPPHNIKGDLRWSL